MANTDLLYKVIADTKDFDKPIKKAKETVDKLANTKLTALQTTFKGMGTAITATTKQLHNLEQKLVSISKHSVKRVFEGIAGGEISGALADLAGGKFATILASSLGGAIATVLGGFGATAVGAGIGALIGSAIDETLGKAIHNALDNLRNSAKVDLVIKGSGADAAAIKPQLDKMKEMLTQAGSVMGAEVDGAFAKFVDLGFKAKDAISFLPATLQASAKAGVSLEEGAELVGRALNGQVRAAMRIGIVLSQNKDAAAAYAENLEKFNKMYSGETFAYKMEDLQPALTIATTINELLAGLGENLLEKLQPTFEKIRHFFKGLLSDDFKGNWDEIFNTITTYINNVIEGVKTFAVAIAQLFSGDYWEKFSFKDMFTSLGDILLEVGKTLFDLLVKAGDLIGAKINEHLPAWMRSEDKVGDAQIEAEKMTKGQRFGKAKELREQAAKGYWGNYDESPNLLNKMADAYESKSSETVSDILARGKANIGAAGSKALAATQIPRLMDDVGKGNLTGTAARMRDWATVIQYAGARDESHARAGAAQVQASGDTPELIAAKNAQQRQAQIDKLGELAQRENAKITPTVRAQIMVHSNMNQLTVS